MTYLFRYSVELHIIVNVKINTMSDFYINRYHKVVSATTVRKKNKTIVWKKHKHGCLPIKWYLQKQIVG